MYDIPQGFIDRAIGEVRVAFFSDRNNGEYHPAEHYSIIEAESIWNSYIRWKNQDSARNDRSALTLQDIESGCRRWATDLSKKSEDFPMCSRRKNAGVCVWHERNR